jgi:Cof subfamily protein (haloacid dehalogenase superfamily)
MKQAIRLLALDLDGTLAMDDHKISPATRIALEQLHTQEDVEVVIATGRRYRTTRYVADNLGFDVAIVCNGGALVKNKRQETLQSTEFNLEQIAFLTGTARELGMTLSAQRDSHHHGGPDFLLDNAHPLNAQAQMYLDQNADHAVQADLMTAATDTLVIGAFDEEGKLEAFRRRVDADPQNRFNTIVIPHLNSPFHYCEVIQKHVDKWYGLKLLAEQKAITATNICAAGDQMNDYPMIQAVAHGVAMGNGNPALQAIAEFVCGDHDKDGLLEVVDYIRRHNELAS